MTEIIARVHSVHLHRPTLLIFLCCPSPRSRMWQQVSPVLSANELWL